MPPRRRRLRVRARRALVHLSLLAALAPDPLPGQATACPLRADREQRCVPPPARSDWQEHALTLGVNALIGGLTAGALQEARGGSFLDGLRRGSLGGALTYGGKRLAVESFPGAGLAGREVAAFGSSVVRNAALGRPSLSEIVLPLGPVRLYVRHREADPVRAQLDVAALALLAVAGVDRDLDLDVGASLSSGALVFLDRGWTAEDSWTARQLAGLIYVRADPAGLPEGERMQWILAHERIHVLQYDQAFLLWGEPLERAVLPRLPGGERLGRWVDLAMETPLWGALHLALAYHDRPWEAEAYFLSGTRERETGAVGWIATVNHRRASHIQESAGRR